jgi:hypothetical protein
MRNAAIDSVCPKAENKKEEIQNRAHADSVKQPEVCIWAGSFRSRWSMPFQRSFAQPVFRTVHGRVLIRLQAKTCGRLIASLL